MSFSASDLGLSQQNLSASALGASRLNDNSSKSELAAPLDQNVKNLVCDGVRYKVVKEEPPKGMRQQLPISPSRNAFKRKLEQSL